MKKAIYRRGTGVLLLALVVLTLLSLSACGREETERQYDYLVTFDYNIGTGIDANCTDQYLGVSAGALIPFAPTAGMSSFELQAVIGYANEGWYTAKTDAEGKPLIGEDGRVVLGEKWSFETDRVLSDLTLYANFLRNPTLRIVDEADPSVVYASYSGVTGSTRREPSKRNSPEKAGYTFYGYYRADGTRVEWPYTFGAEDETVTARFIEGQFAVVRTAGEFASALAQNQSIYVDADLSFSGSDKWLVGKDYSGTIQGNGHVLSGITAELIYSKTSSERFGLFGVLREGAVIRDLTFSDVQMSFRATVTGFGIRVSALAAGVESGVLLEGVTVSGEITCVPSDALEASDVTYYPFLPLGAEALAAYGTCSWSEMTVPAA